MRDTRSITLYWGAGAVSLYHVLIRVLRICSSSRSRNEFIFYAKLFVDKVNSGWWKWSQRVCGQVCRCKARKYLFDRSCFTPIRNRASRLDSYGGILLSDVEL